MTGAASSLNAAAAATTVTCTRSPRLAASPAGQPRAWPLSSFARAGLAAGGVPPVRGRWCLGQQPSRPVAGSAPRFACSERCPPAVRSILSEMMKPGPVCTWPRELTCLPEVGPPRSCPARRQAAARPWRAPLRAAAHRRCRCRRRSVHRDDQPPDTSSRSPGLRVAGATHVQVWPCRRDGHVPADQDRGHGVRKEPEARRPQITNARTAEFTPTPRPDDLAPSPGRGGSQRYLAAQPAPRTWQVGATVPVDGREGHVLCRRAIAAALAVGVRVCPGLRTSRTAGTCRGAACSTFQPRVAACSRSRGSAISRAATSGR